MARVVLATATVLALTCASAAATTIPSKGYFNHKGIYDCLRFQPEPPPGFFTTVDVYKFSPGGKYYVSIGRNGRTLDPPVTTGTYKLVGNKVVPKSGILKNLGEYMKIEPRALQVFKNIRGVPHITGLTCELRYPKPPPPPPPPASLGKYLCYETAENTDGFGRISYSSSWAATFTLYNNHTYENGFLATGDWHQSGNQVVFTSGPFWGYLEHAVGILYPSGVTMPHAQPPFDPSALYTLVIKDTAQEGGNPPSVEWSSTDGPHGTYSSPESFFYCKQ